MSTAKTKNLCPIKIDTDIQSRVRIGDFVIRKMTHADRIKLFGIKDIQLNKDKSLKTCTFVTPRTGYPILLDLSSFDTMRVFSAEHIIEFSKSADAYKIRDLLLAFRLYKKGQIFAPVSFFAEVISGQKSAGWGSVGRPYFTKDDKLYRISKHEIKHVRKIFFLLQKMRSESSFNLALERYKFAMDRNTNDRNSYIELVSILESIFLDNNVHELSFRFSLILSYILSNELGVSVSFKQIKDIYTTRSKLVHEGKSKLYNKQNLGVVKEYTRKLILWVLRNQFTYKEMQTMILSKLNVRE